MVPEKAPAPIASRTSTILVVDDTPDNISLMSGLLRDEYRVLVALNGEKALAVAAEERPDLVLLDIMMPGMDGYEVCGRLKASEATRDIPVIFLTALSAEQDERKGFSLGAVDYITKPISPPLVLARVATHLTLSRARQFLVDKNAYLEAEITRRVEELDRVQDVFGKIVDPRVRDHLLRKGAALQGESAEGAVLFCDIRGFTSYAESRDPREVIEFLNRFFSEAAERVEAEGGFVNKYIGDAFLAIFGTPFPVADFRVSAVRTALAVRKAVADINAASPGREPFGVRMGVHAGPMVAGIVGSPRRQEFTAIGDTVNTASRLEALCKDHGVDLLVSGELLAGTPYAAGPRSLGEFPIRGKERPVGLFTL